MMTNDSERREVARMLRGIDTERIDRRCGPTSSKLATLEAMDEAVGSFVEGFTFSATRFRDRLIDLIEPGDTSQGCRDTVACDRDALLELADEIDMLATRLSLGDTVIRSKDIYEYAKMIRDAVSMRDES